MALFSFSPKNDTTTNVSGRTIAEECTSLAQVSNRGELGSRIAPLVLAYSPGDIQQMKRNFETKVRDLDPEYRERLTKKIAEHLLGTYQRIRLDNQQGVYKTMTQLVTEKQKTYWTMVAGQCSKLEGGDAPSIRFLKYLLAGYCMIVLEEPGHPVGMPFPGNDTVQLVDGTWYCPVRDKAGDVDAALCPFCPARQTPEIGYLRPPVGGSDHRKKEYIEHIHQHHHFNG
ncbi:MAG: DUF2115 domain-containing protein [Methanomicrobiales archaeon]|nr:DUF2115 domain-containing protein [Methanomicrobiales archaeon]